MKRISIKGFKAINKEKKMDLAPINLLIGPNGSGKSSLINSLVLSKGMFDVEIVDGPALFTPFIPNTSDLVIEELFPPRNFVYRFEDRLKNPF